MSFQTDGGRVMVLNMCQERCCLFCGKRLYGRSDKKYCDDGCRNNHHYKIKRNDDDLQKSIDEALHHNRKVMRLFCDGSKTVVKKQSLLDCRFDFNVMTGVYKTKKGAEYHIVYDYAYKFVNKEDVLLIKFVARFCKSGYGCENASII